AQRRLQVQRRRVVDARPDLGLAQGRADAVALGRTADEEVVDVAGILRGQLDQLAEAELRVPRRRLAPLAVPAVDVAEEEAQEGGLELVEARVVADQVEVGLVARAVEGQQAETVGELLARRRAP